MSRPNNWQDYWLDLDCGGFPLRKWCTNVTKKQGFAHCRICNLTLKYLYTGVGALKAHGMSKRHLENCKGFVGVSKAKSTKTSSVPSPKNRQKKESYVTEIKTAKCNNQERLKKVSSLNPRHFKRIVHEAGDTTLGPAPYFQVSNNEFRNALIPVYPCCYCPKEFMSKDLLRDHQVLCIMKPPLLQAVLPSDNDSAPSDQAPPTISTLAYESQPKIFLESPSNSPHVQLSKSDFIAGLNLLPKKKARQAPKRRRNTECENIDWEEEVPITPTTPSANRTPKLLISHLSRDGQDHYRRRLSFSVDGKANKEKDHEEDRDGDHTQEQERKMTVCKSLYNLDVTSVLGQFVIKHFKGDPSLHILSDIESHCLTSSSAPKNSSISRLRVRNAIYPITFRGYTGKFSGSYAHQYKFNKRQVREFMRTVETGLDKMSRVLRRQMKSCKIMLKPLTKADLRHWIPSQNQPVVDLKPLSAAEIAFWTRPKPPPSPETLSIFPKGLNFTSPNVNSILGLRTRQGHPNSHLRTSSLSLSNFVSEEVCAELVQNRKTLYRSLLSDCSSKDGCLLDGENLSISHLVSFPVLRQMLKHTATKTLNNSTSHVVLTDSLVSFKDTNGDQKRRPGVKVKDNKSKTKDSGYFSDSLYQLIGVDICEGKHPDNLASSECSIKKRKIWSSSSDDTEITPFIHEDGPKCLGGFVVNSRTAGEGDEIKTFTESPQRMSSFLRTVRGSDRNERARHRKLYKRIRCHEYDKANGLSSRTRTMRSSPITPFSVPSRRDLRMKERNMGLRRTTGSLDISNLNSIQEKNVLATNNSIKKDVILQKRTRHQYAKHCHRISHKSPHKFPGDQFQRAGGKSPERSLFNGSASLLERRLSAAGLVKRDSCTHESVSSVSGRMTKPTVPIPNKPSMTPRSSTTTSDSGIATSSPDESGPSHKQPLRHVALRKAKSQSHACFVEQSSRLRNKSRRKLKDQKHKSFMLWLQNLKKGNIT